jgi:hypothetical protein
MGSIDLFNTPKSFPILLIEVVNEPLSDTAVGLEVVEPVEAVLRLDDVDDDELPPPPSTKNVLPCPSSVLRLRKLKLK